MLKYFREVRLKLLPGNRFSKYLIYAVGEIVLVVIGILIALQINNRNRIKVLKAKEYAALFEVISDLNLNILRLNGVVYEDANSIYKCTSSLDIIITNIECTRVYHDSLATYFWLNFRYPDLDVKSSGYESLTSIGLDLVANNELRAKIGKYYSYSIPNVNLAYQDVRDDYYHYMLDYLRREFITVGTDGNTKKIYPVSYDLLLENREYIESLKTYLTIFNFYRDRSMEAIEESEALKIQIENYLNK